MTKDLNELRELREIVMGEFITDYGGGNVGLTPAGEKLVELIDAAISADSATRGRTGGKVHSLKCWPEFFQAVKSGAKPFEIRYNDRGYQVGDWLELHEFDPETREYTAEEPITREVTYVLAGEPYVPFMYVCMGLSAYRRPTEDKVAEIDRAISILTKGREQFSYRAINAFDGALDLAITALHKMKGDWQYCIA